MSLCPLSNILYINNTPSKCSKPVGICGIFCGSAAASEETSTAALQWEFSEMQLSWSASGWGFGQAKIWVLEFKSLFFHTRETSDPKRLQAWFSMALTFTFVHLFWNVFTVNIWFHSKKYSFCGQGIYFILVSAIALPIPACPDATCHVSPVSNCFGEQLGTLHLKWRWGVLARKPQTCLIIYATVIIVCWMVSCNKPFSINVNNKQAEACVVLGSDRINSVDVPPVNQVMCQQEKNMEEHKSSITAIIELSSCDFFEC